MMNQAMQRAKNMDTDTDDAHNLTEEVLDHLRVNVRFEYYHL